MSIKRKHYEIVCGRDDSFTVLCRGEIINHFDCATAATDYVDECIEAAEEAAAAAAWEDQQIDRDDSPSIEWYGEGGWSGAI